MAQRATQCGRLAVERRQNRGRIHRPASKTALPCARPIRRRGRRASFEVARRPTRRRCRGRTPQGTLVVHARRVWGRRALGAFWRLGHSPCERRGESRVPRHPTRPTRRRPTRKRNTSTQRAPRVSPRHALCQRGAGLRARRGCAVCVRAPRHPHRAKPAGRVRSSSAHPTKCGGHRLATLRKKDASPLACGTLHQLRCVTQQHRVKRAEPKPFRGAGRRCPRRNAAAHNGHSRGQRQVPARPEDWQRVLWRSLPWYGALGERAASGAPRHAVANWAVPAPSFPLLD